jgi:hypothetical protein
MWPTQINIQIIKTLTCPIMTQIGKEEVKLSLFSCHMNLYLKDTKHATKNTLSDKHFQESIRIQNHYTPPHIKKCNTFLTIRHET